MLMYLGQDDALGYDAEHEGILTIRKLSRSFWTLPTPIFLHQVNMVQCTVIKL